MHRLGAQVMAGGPVPPLPSCYSPALQELVTSMLQLDPQKRPTAVQLADDTLLQVCTAGGGVPMWLAWGGRGLPFFVLGNLPRPWMLPPAAHCPFSGPCTLSPPPTAAHEPCLTKSPSPKPASPTSTRIRPPNLQERALAGLPEEVRACLPMTQERSLAGSQVLPPIEVPASTAVFHALNNHLPTPRQDQPCWLPSGPLSDAAVVHIRGCLFVRLG